MVGAIVGEVVKTVVGDTAATAVFKMQVIAVGAASVIDTAQAVEGERKWVRTVKKVHRQFRKLTKTKGGFPNENSLLK